MARPPRTSPETKRRPTMLDVAKLAGGVHPSTVSLVLRNSPNISEATRKRVLAAVRKVGYRRDPLLDAYNHHRMGVIPHKSEPIIACVSDVESKEELERREPHRSFLRGAREAAEHLHCRLEIFLIGKGQLSPERLNGILHARGITAMLVLALSRESERLPFTWEDFSALRIGGHRLRMPRLSVASDQRQGARLAHKALTAAGYQRIGLLLGPGASAGSCDQLLAGHLLEHSRLPLDSQPPPLLLPQTGDHRTLVRDWIRGNRIDAVCAELGALRDLLPTEAGKTRVGFAALDVAGEPAETAGIVHDHARVGQQAVEQLIGLMRANQRGLAPAEACTYVPVTWRSGASAPPRH